MTVSNYLGLKELGTTFYVDGTKQDPNFVTYSVLNVIYTVSSINDTSVY